MSKRELRDLYRGAIQAGCFWVKMPLVQIYLDDHIPVKEEEYALWLIKQQCNQYTYKRINDMIYNRGLEKWKNKIKIKYKFIIQKDIDTIIFNRI